MSRSPGRQRLDQLLADRGICDSRARARDAILRGHVTVDGATATKPGQSVDGGADIRVADPAAGYVSRAALKLVAALDGFDLDINGLSGLDIGASTGGFTQVALARGAAHIVAIDVGHDQMHASVAGDLRVTRIDGLNARALTQGHLHGHEIGLVMSDVSFISLKLALPPALDLARPGAIGVFLVKPQFEAGREAIGKGGILRDPALGPAIAGDLASWLNERPGWSALGTMPSPIEGSDGNREYLLAGRKA